MSYVIKAFNPGTRTTTIQGIEWPVRVGAWTPAVVPVLCESGWHGWRSLNAVLHNALRHDLWLMQLRGATVEDNRKVAGSQAKLVRQLPWDDRSRRLFAADCAERVLPLFEAKYPGDTRPRDAIVVARRFAAGDATRTELDAARAAAWDAAAWAAAGAAARAAAGAAARAAAWDAARAAAWDAARAAAWAAERAAERSWQVDRLGFYLGVTDRLLWEPET